MTAARDTAPHDTPTIRDATEADAVAMHKIEQQLFPNDAWSLAMIKDELTAPYRRYFILENAGEVSGYAGALILPPDADVQTIAIAPELQGMGYGAKLLETLLGTIQDAGAKEVFLEVRADNPRAISLYQKYGFEEIAVRERYYQPEGVDAIIMRLDLRNFSASEANKADAHDDQVNKNSDTSGEEAR